jgi:hypothetical protein
MCSQLAELEDEVRVQAERIVNGAAVTQPPAANKVRRCDLKAHIFRLACQLFCESNTSSCIASSLHVLMPSELLPLDGCLQVQASSGAPFQSGSRASAAGSPASSSGYPSKSQGNAAQQRPGSMYASSLPLSTPSRPVLQRPVPQSGFGGVGGFPKGPAALASTRAVGPQQPAYLRSSYQAPGPAPPEQQSASPHAQHPAQQHAPQNGPVVVAAVPVSPQLRTPAMRPGQHSMITLSPASAGPAANSKGDMFR